MMNSTHFMIHFTYLTMVHYDVVRSLRWRKQTRVHKFGFYVCIPFTTTFFFSLNCSQRFFLSVTSVGYELLEKQLETLILKVP